MQNGLTRSTAAGAVGPMTLMLLKASFADVLMKQGTSLAAWASACVAGLPACRNDLAALEAVFVNATLLDPTAGAMFAGVSPGRYYVFAQMAFNNQLLVWDVRVDLREGDNVLTLDQRNITPLDAAQSRAMASAAAPSGVPPAVEPSIAKARAANVDTKVFGIPLGEPLRLPTCDLLQAGSTLSLGTQGTPTGFTPPATCLFDDSLGDLVTSLLPFTIERDANQTAIMLAKESCPSWITSCTATATLHEGLLVAVTLITRGRGVEDTIGRELRGKYGAPTRVHSGVVNPDVGNPFNVNDLEWTRPGLHVEYEVVRRLETDAGRVRTTEGRVRIESELAYQRRTAQEQDAAKPKL